MDFGNYKIDVGFIASLGKTKFSPAGKALIYSKDCNPNQPKIGDTRTSYQVCSTFASNIKAPISVRGRLSGNYLTVGECLEGTYDVQSFMKAIKAKEGSNQNFVRFIFGAFCVIMFCVNQ